MAMSIDTSVQTVIEVLTRLGIDPAANQLPDSGGRGWAVPAEGSVLFLRVIEVEGQPALQMTCPILYMPPQDLLPFYRRLLDINTELANAALAMDRDIVVVVARQAVDGLTADALESLLRQNQHVTDMLAKGLIQEFNGARFWKPM
jgi:hypothetical protein